MQRPQPDDYDPYYHTYVGAIETDDLDAALREEGRAMQELLATLDEARGDHRYAPGKWSIKEILGHLLDSERIFSVRALCFARGDRRPWPGYEDEIYIKEGGFSGRTLQDLSHELELLRASTRALFRGLDERVLDRPGVANGLRVTPRALGFVVAGHARHHREFIQRMYL